MIHATAYGGAHAVIDAAGCRARLGKHGCHYTQCQGGNGTGCFMRVLHDMLLSNGLQQLFCLTN
jgi:hypothetical protein